MRTALITGGAGFFGGILKRELLEKGWTCVSIDLQKDDDVHPRLTSVQGDIRDCATMERICMEHRFDVIFHCAAILAHAVTDKKFLWSCNVDGTRMVAEIAKQCSIPRIVAISSNCIWGEATGRPMKEDDPPLNPEIYGRSKWAAENVLREFWSDLNIAIIRCPTILDAGRLGLLAILFEFIDDGRKVWVVGGGENRYQFIYAKDLADACIRASAWKGSDIFQVGSDDVPTFREAYGYVITQAKTGARVANFPRMIAIPLMKLAYALRLSPLGPYQYKMIAEDFVFDTSKAKQLLGWRPTLTNGEMLWKSFEFYRDHRGTLQSGSTVSAHRQAAKMGVIRVLKWLS